MTLTLAFAGISVVHAEPETLTVTLRAQASAEGSFIKLSEIAKLSGNAALADKARSILMGRTPSNAKPAVVTAGKILEALMRNGIGRDDVVMAGANTCDVFAASHKKIEIKEEDAATATDTADTNGVSNGEIGGGTRRGVTIGDDSDDQVQPETLKTEKKKKTTAADADELVKKAIEEIRAMTAKELTLDAADVAVTEVLRNAALRRLPEGVATLEDVIPMDVSGSVLGRHSFNIIVKVRDAVLENCVLQVDLERFADVVVANRKLSSREAIKEGDVRIERRPFTTRAANYYTDIKAVLGMAPKTSLNSDAILIPSGLEPAVVIRRGDTVTVTVNGGVATVPGEAAEDGVVGKTIKVWRLKPKMNDKNEVLAWERAAMVIGRVTGEGLVEVSKQ